MENETLDNILENQDKKITETNQLLENVLENNDDNAKKGLKKQEEILKKVSEKPEVQKMALEGAEIVTIKGKNGDKGDKGDSIKGDKGDSIKGDKGDSIKGDKGDKGNKGESVKGDKGNDGDKGDKGDSIKGDKGDDGKDADIKEIIKILEKRKISYKDLKDIPDIYKGKLMGSGYLKEITDIEILTTPTDGQSLVYDGSKKQWKAGASSAGTVENLSGQCDGSTTIFTTTSNTGIIWLSLNGAMLVEGKEFTRDSATQITLTFAPETGEELYLKYV
jgi:hypothetical protein